MNKLICFFLFTITLNAQPDNYVFSIIKDVPYTKLDSSTTITYAGWDDFEGEVPLGFNFKMMGKTTNKLYFDSLSYNYGTDLIFTKSTNSTNIISTYMDLVDRSVEEPEQSSFVSYVNSKDSQGKITTTIQWSNCGLFDQVGDSLNMQMRFYENGNKLEYHFGESSYEGIENHYKNENNIGSKGPFIVFGKNINLFNLNAKIYYTKSSAPPSMDSTTIGEILDIISTIGLDSFPHANTVFQWFIPITNGVDHTILDDQISIYPTVIRDVLYLDTKESYNVEVINLQGQSLLNYRSNTHSNQLNLSELSSGYYFIKFSNGNKEVNYKFQKI